MAEEPAVVHGINWKETFPFTLIFRTFRIAIHPSKLVLALLALLSIYAAGRLMDAVWPAEHNGVPQEVELYEVSRSSAQPERDFMRERDRRRAQIVNNFREELTRIGHPQGGLRDIRWRIERERDEAVARVRQQPADTPEARAQRDAQIRAIYQEAYARYREYRQINGEGLFKLAFEYQAGQIYQILTATTTGNVIGPGGVFTGLYNFLVIGPAWALSYHYVYFILFGIIALIIWAIFGGAISRIAAVHVARDEKISIRQALAFSSNKFLSFVSAPIIPLLIVLVVGLVLAIGGLIGNIPFLGPILVGALFFLALAAGFVMTLVLLGLFGGFNLMYPTIAVEGSDSFDAISRSFSYLYARPWRLAFYSAVALIYGAVTYLFVRFFIYLLLYLTHAFVGLFFFTRADSTEPLWPTMWPNPMTTPRLVYDIDFLTLAGGQDLGAALLSFWVYLTIGMLGAFAISFYFSANTIIYYLMRHEVDATELDDVYLEQSEDEFPESATTPMPSTAAGGPVAAGAAGAAVAPAPVTGSDVPASPAPEPGITPGGAPGVLPESTPPPTTPPPGDEEQTPPV